MALEADKDQDPPASPASPQSPGIDASCAGKWVAVVHGRVAAVGETALQARLRALRNWPKDEAVVLYIPAGGLQVQVQGQGQK
jgi:hypothetical protein